MTGKENTSVPPLRAGGLRSTSCRGLDSGVSSPRMQQEGMDFQQIEGRTKAIEQMWVRPHLGYSAQSGPLWEVLGISTRQAGVVVFIWNVCGHLPMDLLLTSCPALLLCPLSNLLQSHLESTPATFSLCWQWLQRVGMDSTSTATHR